MSGYTVQGVLLRFGATILAGFGLFALVGCDETGQFRPFQPQESDQASTGGSNSKVKLVERDVEVPEVFQVTDKGLWDGRPSLGGVWVAHPDVKEPERVIIRNTDNSNFVIGALFRRERDNPGPIFQLSSDAADALGVLAGAPVTLNVTALRRAQEKEPEKETASAAKAVAGTAQTSEVKAGGVPAPGEIKVQSLDPVAADEAVAKPKKEAASASVVDVTEVAAGALAKAETKPAPSAVAPAAASAPVAVPEGTKLEKPYIQVGIFNLEENARKAESTLRGHGLVPDVLAQTSQGKKFWRVIVGPVGSSSERSSLLKKIEQAGFGDAYPVTN